MNTQLERAAKEIGFLTLEEEQDLLAKARAGCSRSRDRVALAHLPLVMAQVSKYAAYHSMDDLISCGTIGLLKAIDRYRPERTRGGRFATYATWWIRSEVGEFMLAQKSLVRIGTTSSQKVAAFGLNKAKMKLGIDGPNLTPQQVTALATELQISEATVAEMHVRLMSDLSLNAPVVDTEGTAAANDTFLDQLEDPNWVPQDEQMILLEQKAGDTEALQAALASLKPRQRYVLERRLLTDEKVTLEVLSQELGVSRERCRQLQVQALKKVEKHLTGKAKPRVGRAKPDKRAVRQERIAYVRANMDRMRPVEMAKALGVNPKTIGNYLRAVRRAQALPLAA